MKRVPPAEVIEELKVKGVDFEDVELSVYTDINVLGEYDIQWLIASPKKLFVFDPHHGTEPLFDFDLGSVEDFRNLTAVGSGLLQIRVDGVWIDLMRFSNRIKYYFDRALKRLQQIKKGECLAPPEWDQRDPHKCPQCGMMLEFPDELCLQCVNHRAAFGRLLEMMRPYWNQAAVMMVILIFGIGLDMAWPLLTRFLVDYVLAVGGNPRPPMPYPWLIKYNEHSLLVLVVATLAGVQMIRAILNLWNGRIAGRVGNALTYDVRGRLVYKLEQLSLAYYSKQETGSLVGRVAYDTEAIQSFITQLTSGFFMQFLLVIVSFVMMMALKPELALWALIPTPFVLGGAYIYWRFVHPHFQRFWYRSSKQAGQLNGILSGIRVVKAFNQEENEFQKFQKTSMDLRESKDTLDRTSAYFYPLMAVVFQVGGWIIWYVGGLNVLDGKVSLGTLMAFFGYLSMFYGPLGSLTNLTTWLTQFSTQMHRIFEILDTPTVLPEAEAPKTLERAEGRIKFDDVTFGYTRGITIIKNLNFEIQPGERIGIVGRSGSGKTSIINLLCRFYDVDSGKILIDGTDIREISKEDLRAQIGIVLQEPFLFKGTLIDNISYGRLDASFERILEVSKAASAHELVMKHPLAYDTNVGERGAELSGGERQRISIARALLCASKILILDEATSNIDSESELQIQLALREISKNRTTLVIAHRLSTVRSCDRIFVIENGELVENGTHGQLMRLSGRYARWVGIQQGEGPDNIEEEKDLEARHKKYQNSMDQPELRWLSPELDSFQVGLRHELQLRTREGRTFRGVFALRCFPIHHPDEYISIRSFGPENRVYEMGIIRDLREWSLQDQGLVRESLRRRYFFHTIQRIKSIAEIAQFLTVKAHTDMGDVDFILRYSPESAQDYGKKGKLLIDVEDNLYLVPDMQKMPRSDRILFNRYVYW